MGRRLTGVKNRLSKEVCIDAAAAYPRSPGEQWWPGKAYDDVFGLSPLSRGTVWYSGRSYRPSRFIPARAGNSAHNLVEHVFLAVYPRSRREQSGRTGKDMELIGLSPLARGTVQDVRAELNGPRFIPARAGNSSGRKSGAERPTVYPRSRGEQYRMSNRPC